MHRFRNPCYEMESLERKLSPSSVVTVPVVAEVAIPTTQSADATQVPPIVDSTTDSDPADTDATDIDPTDPADPTTPVDPTAPADPTAPVPTGDSGDPPSTGSPIDPDEDGLPNY